MVTADSPLLAPDDGCTCTLIRSATHIEPAEWDQDPDCSVHGYDADEPPCGHDWLDRPESDTSECLVCGLEISGPPPVEVPC